MMNLADPLSDKFAFSVANMGRLIGTENRIKSGRCNAELPTNLITKQTNIYFV